jgi:hypothetical protein
LVVVHSRFFGNFLDLINDLSQLATERNEGERGLNLQNGWNSSDRDMKAK